MIVSSSLQFFPLLIFTLKDFNIIILKPVWDKPNVRIFSEYVFLSFFCLLLFFHKSCLLACLIIFYCVLYNVCNELQRLFVALVFYSRGFTFASGRSP